MNYKTTAQDNSMTYICVNKDKMRKIFLFTSRREMLIASIYTARNL